MQADTETQPTVLLTIHANGGYAPDQIADPMTIRDLIDLLTTAADDHGLDARVVTVNPQNRYGAQYGYVDRWADVEPVLGRCGACGEEMPDDDGAYHEMCPTCEAEARDVETLMGT